MKEIFACSEYPAVCSEYPAEGYVLADNVEEAAELFHCGYCHAGIDGKSLDCVPIRVERKLEQSEESSELRAELVELRDRHAFDQVWIKTMENSLNEYISKVVLCEDFIDRLAEKCRWRKQSEEPAPHTYDKVMWIQEYEEDCGGAFDWVGGFCCSKCVPPESYWRPLDYPTVKINEKDD